MREVALTLRQPTLPLRQGAVPQRGEGVDNQFNLLIAFCQQENTEARKD